MGAESDPTARCTPWREYLDRTKGWHERPRIGLREMLGTPQGESRGFGLADVSLAVGAIHRLRTTLRFDPVPDENVENGIGNIEIGRASGQESVCQSGEIWVGADVLTKNNTN